jgi:hypothetical protein
MHGTYVEERKLIPHTRDRLISGDCLRFGAEVTRGPGTCWINDEPAPSCCAQPIRWLPLSAKGDFFSTLSVSNPLPESFPPLEMYISFHWIDEPYVQRSQASDSTNRACSPHSAPTAPTMVHADLSPNSFSVPDYDEDDDEIEIIHESVRVPRVEVAVPSCHRYTVPESDLSCAGSFSSDSSSEPPTPSPRNSRLKIAPWKQVSENIKEPATEHVVASPPTARERLAALTDAPSAAGFFQISNEQSVPDDPAQGQSRSTNERGDMPTITDASYESIEIMDDEDLTESDVEFADGYSDDLFDDDAENAQPELIVESPPLSEYDDGEEEGGGGGGGGGEEEEDEEEEEEEEDEEDEDEEEEEEEAQASNRGMEPVESTTYPEVQQLGDVTGEDETRVVPTDREPGELLGLRSPLVDAIYSPNPIPFKQTFAAKLSNNATSDARAPSPSDAAMAKATTAQLPSMESAVQMHSSFIAPMTSDFPRLSNTESPYARSTWSAWPEYTADLPSECVAPVYNPFNPSFLYQEGPFAYRQPGESINADDLVDRGEEETGASQKGTFSKPGEQRDSNKISTHPFTPAVAPEVEQHANVVPPSGLRATRLSIYDIVEKNTQDASIQNKTQTLKRKADDLSIDDDALAMDLASSDPQVISELGLAPQAAEKPPPTKPQTAMPPTTDADAVVGNPTSEAVEQPAHKRAKTGVAKYAAAVFAGVVAGGVGTMAALLALPPIHLS